MNDDRETRDPASYFAASDFEYDSAHEATPRTSGAVRAEDEEPTHNLVAETTGNQGDGDYGYDEAHDMWTR